MTPARDPELGAMLFHVYPVNRPTQFSAFSRGARGGVGSACVPFNLNLVGHNWESHGMSY